MSATVENTQVNQVKLTVTVDAATFEEAMQRAYLKMRSRIAIPGFRKGKAPRKVIEKFYSEAVFYEDAFDIVFPKAYDEAIDENGLYPVDQPNVDIVEIGEGKDLVFTAEVTVKPEVELGQYKGIEAKKPEYNVSEEEIDAEIARAQDRVARYIDVDDRACQTGDRVVIDYAGSVDGVPFEGGTAEKQNLDLGSGRFIPGFEGQVEGMKVGEERDITVTFPEDYHAEELKGKEAVFHIVLHGISYKEVPEVNDEFAKDVSEFDTLEAYKASIRERLEKAAERRATTEYHNQLVDKAVQNATVEIPGCMVERQLDYMMQEMEYQMMYQGIKMDDYLKMINTTREELREQNRQEAEKRVKTQLVIEKIQQVEGIEVTDEEVEAELASMATEERTVEDVKKTMSPQDLDYIRGNLLSDKTIKVLEENAVAGE